MAKDLNKLKTGGQFLLDSINKQSIYSREDFTSEHNEIFKMVKSFDEDRVLPQKDALDDFNPDIAKGLLRELGDLGLLGVDIPEEYGGIDLDKITSAIIAESLVHNPSFAVTWSVQTGIGSLPIIWFGTDDQKKYLPKIATGEVICAYGLTEPSSGSDAMQAKTTAVLSEDNEHYILNGEKVFITNGGWAEVFIVFAQVDGNKFSAFIIEKDTEGFSVGREEKKLGMKGSSTAQLVFQNAKVPKDNLLYKVGKGATIAFNCLNIGRFKLGCSCLGGSKRAITAATKYAIDRQAFGTTISQFDGIKRKIAEMSVLTFATDTMIYRTIGLLQDEIDLVEKDSNDDYYIHIGEAMGKYAIETSMVKVFGSDCSHWVIDQGLQVLGGYGFLEEYPLASAYRDDRINQIWEGTNEINRQIIAGFFMKKALMDELPIRNAIKEIDAFLTSEESVDDAPLAKECNTVDAAKKLALYLFDRSLAQYAQDLKNEHQILEMLSDVFTDIYTAESTILRAQKIMESDNAIPTAVDIARVFSTEMVNRVMSNAHLILNALYSGSLNEDVRNKLKIFEERMRLSNDVVQLKRNIAEYVFEKKEYPY